MVRLLIAGAIALREISWKLPFTKVSQRVNARACDLLAPLKFACHISESETSHG